MGLDRQFIEQILLSRARFSASPELVDQLLRGRRRLEFTLDLGSADVTSRTVRRRLDRLAQALEEKRYALESRDLAPNHLKIVIDKTRRTGAEPRPVEVILVVKGAGTHEESQTLDVFTNGFLPAIHALEPHATTRRRVDLSGSTRESARPLDQVAGSVTEIDCPYSNRIVRIREAYWEYELVPGKPTQVLARQARMALWVLVKEFYELAMQLLKVPTRAEHDAESVSKLRSWVVKSSSPVVLWVSISWILFLIFVFVPYMTLPEFNAAYQLFGLRVNSSVSSSAWLLLSLLTPVVGLFVTLGIESWHEDLRDWARGKGDGPAPLPTRRGIPTAVVAILGIALLASPLRYLHLLLTFAGLQLASNLALLVLQPANRREESHSESEERWWYRLALYFAGQHFVYRFAVVMTLPIFYILLVVAAVLVWTKVLAIPGRWLDSVVRSAVSRVMGDVTTYAADPSRAMRIRSVFENEVRLLNARDEVKRIHVVAHSLGTPITFESLFFHMPPELRRKIATYITLGSVLNYFHDAEPVLSPYEYRQRFPPSSYPGLNEFAPGFQWWNFWSMTDPITGFRGLEVFNLPFGTNDPDSSEDEWLPLDWVSSQSRRRKTLIQSNYMLKPSIRHHGDYWVNPDVMLPVATRVLAHSYGADWEETSTDEHRFGISSFLSFVLGVFLLVSVYQLSFSIAPLTVMAEREMFALASRNASLLTSLMPEWVVKGVSHITSRFGIDGWRHALEQLYSIVAMSLLGVIPVGFVLNRIWRRLSENREEVAQAFVLVILSMFMALASLFLFPAFWQSGAGNDLLEQSDLRLQPSSGAIVTASTEVAAGTTVATMEGPAADPPPQDTRRSSTAIHVGIKQPPIRNNPTPGSAEFDGRYKLFVPSWGR